MKRNSIIISLLIAAICILSNAATAADRYEIAIPDIMGYQTLKCDFHMHTVFSDGSVWPTVRVDEAWREGLDCIVISDHIEYQPHKNDIPTNHKRPYEIAYGPAKAKNILLIQAAEITRSTPPGHFNVIFAKDIDALDTRGKASPDSKTKTEDELVMALKIAREQGAFSFWNHPNWQAPNGEQVWFDIHKKIFDEKLLDGIEVVNSKYYDKAFAWAIERNLTMFGNSDIHSPSDPPLHNHTNHRDMTLVFATERTLEGVRDALENRRTVVWHGDQLIGRKPYLEALMEASVQVAPPHNQYRNNIYFEVTNNSDFKFELEKISGSGPAQITLTPHRTVVIRASLDKETKNAKLSYKVTNLLIAPGENLGVSGTVDAIE